MNDTPHQWPHHFKVKQALGHCASLPETVWDGWAAHFGARWPANPSERLALIDDDLRAHLLPRDLRPEAVRERRRYVRLSPDLNKHRGWVLYLILKQLKEKALKEPEQNPAYLFPEDLPTLIEDIGIFEKHRNHQAFFGQRVADQKSLRHLSKQAYPTGAALRDLALPWRPKYPRTHKEQDAADARFILEKGGNGHALRVASFDDRTNIVIPLTFEASKAYGSPRWCTVYDELYFDEHSKDGLLFITIGTDGARWQAGLTSNILTDGEDVSVDFSDLPQNAANFLQTEQDRINQKIAEHIKQLKSTDESLAKKSFFAACATPDLPPVFLDLLYELYPSVFQRESLFLDMINTERGKQCVPFLLRDPTLSSSFIEGLLNWTDVNGHSYLSHAIIKKHTACVCAILADPRLTAETVNAKDCHGSTNLGLATLYNCTECVRALLADPRLTAETVNAKDPFGNTILHLSASKGHADIFRILLNDKRLTAETVNAKNIHGNTALIYAAKGGYTDIVLALLADKRLTLETLEAKGNNDMDALSFLEKKEDWESARLLKKRIAELRAERGLSGEPAPTRKEPALPSSTPSKQRLQTAAL